MKSARIGKQGQVKNKWTQKGTQYQRNEKRSLRLKESLSVRFMIKKTRQKLLTLLKNGPSTIRRDGQLHCPDGHRPQGGGAGDDLNSRINKLKAKLQRHMKDKDYVDLFPFDRVYLPLFHSENGNGTSPCEEEDIEAKRDEMRRVIEDIKAGNLDNEKEESEVDEFFVSLTSHRNKSQTDQRLRDTAVGAGVGVDDENENEEDFTFKEYSSGEERRERRRRSNGNDRERQMGGGGVDTRTNTWSREKNNSVNDSELKRRDKTSGSIKNNNVLPHPKRRNVAYDEPLSAVRSGEMNTAVRGTHTVFGSDTD